MNSAVDEIHKLRNDYLLQTGREPVEIRISRRLLDRIADETHACKRRKTMSDDQWREHIADTARSGEFRLFNMRVELYE